MEPITVSVDIPPISAIDGVFGVLDLTQRNHNPFGDDHVDESLSRLFVALAANPLVQRYLSRPVGEDSPLTEGSNNLDEMLYLDSWAPDTEMRRLFKHKADIEALEAFVASVHNTAINCKRCQQEAEKNVAPPTVSEFEQFAEKEQEAKKQAA